MKTSIARDVEASENKRKYDEQCKKVLSNLHILAHILKHTVNEVKNMSIQEIVDAIEGKPVIDKTGIMEHTDKIEGSNTEDSSRDEGTLYYDIRFFILINDKDKKVKILFDVEAQKDFYPGYHIVTRGIVYASRMISSQIDKEFDLKHYDDVKKVYSIWICFDVAKKIGNAISRYSIQKEDIIPGIPDEKEAYDKLTVIVICLNEDVESYDDLTKMLNTLFSDTKSSEEIKETLTNKYQIPMDDGYEKEVELMCNLSGKVELKAHKKGFTEGFDKGHEEGEKRGEEKGILALVETLKELNHSYDFIRKKIMERFHLSEEEANKYI